MFDRLKNKWKVGTLDLLLILCTFAIGGSMTGYLARTLIKPLELSGVLFLIAYLIILTLLWPVMVVVVSIPLGQFRFFRNYLLKIARRFGLRRQKDSIE